MSVINAFFRVVFAFAVHLAATSHTCLALQNIPFEINKKTVSFVEKGKLIPLQMSRVESSRFSNTDIERDKGCSIYTSGLSREETKLVQNAVMETLKEYEMPVESPLHPLQMNNHVLPNGAHGATGRVALISSGFLTDMDVDDEESLEDFRLSISAKLDKFVQNGTIDQPILLGVNQDEALSGKDVEQMLARIIENEVAIFSLCEPVVKGFSESFDIDASISKTNIPTIHAKIDGAMVDGIWDTSDIYVFDGLVDGDLTSALRKVVLGQDNSLPTERYWNDIEIGPDPDRWERGGLNDIFQSGDDEIGEATTDGDCWGLSVEAVEDICFNQHDAIDQFESLLSQLFPDFHVCRLPEAVLGDCVSPLTANAATCVDKFSWHIDADPALVPPSPWADVFGRYSNRTKGKPRLISCLVYVNDRWDAKTFGAPTRFFDPPTAEEYNVYPKPGRVLIMDQDITHTVVAPNKTAGNRPRYSLVWKLILHPKEFDQDMSCLFRENGSFPSTQFIGSASSMGEASVTMVT